MGLPARLITVLSLCALLSPPSIALAAPKPTPPASPAPAASAKTTGSAIATAAAPTTSTATSTAITSPAVSGGGGAVGDSSGGLMWLLVLGFGGAGVWMVVASRRRPGEEGSGATIAPAGASAAETIAGAAGGGDWLFSLQGPNGESRERLRLPAVVGRSSSADLTILDAQVSGYHAKLVARAGGVAVVDLGSSNGTFVGDERIGETLLRPGDSFRVGSTTIGFVSGPALDAP